MANKYRAQKTRINGITFDSKREADRYLILLDKQRRGKIKNLRLQPRIPLEGRDGPIMTPTGRQQAAYVADFAYTDTKTGLEIFEDAKGYPTDVYKLKKSVCRAQGVEVIEV